MGTMITLDQTGDTKYVWNKDVEAEVEVARATFEKLKDKGYVAYHVDDKGEKSTVMHEFDATAEKVIMAPAIVGG